MVCIIDAGRKGADPLWGYNNWTCGLGTAESRHQTGEMFGSPVLICIFLAFQEKVSLISFRQS